MATQAVLQGKRFIIAPGVRERETLRNELLRFRLKITKNNIDTYEAWRDGDHDDLVLANAQAVWYGEKVLLPVADLGKRPEARPLGMMTN
jgi:hypothetical protein